MNVPQTQNLHSQSFNSEFIEFVWHYIINDNEKSQTIFKIFKDGSFYIERGNIDSSENYISGIYESELYSSIIGWSPTKETVEFKRLIEEVVEFLK